MTILTSLLVPPRVAAGGAAPAGAGARQVRRGLLSVPGGERGRERAVQRPADHPRTRYVWRRT